MPDQRILHYNIAAANGVPAAIIRMGCLVCHTKCKRKACSKCAERSAVRLGYVRLDRVMLG